MTMVEGLPNEAATDEAEGDSRRKLVLVGALVATLLLAGGGWMLLGGEEEEPVRAAPKRPRAAVNLAAAPAGAPAVVPPRSEEQLGRNPFRVPGAVVAAAAPAVAPLSKTQPVPAAPTAAGPAAPAAPSAVKPGAAKGAPAPAPAPAAPGQPTEQTYPLTLKGFEGDVAQITVADVSYDVEVDQIFGPKNQIKLVSIQEDDNGKPFVVLQVGDESFDAHIGETHQVR